MRWSKHTLRGRSEETLEGERGVNRYRCLVGDLFVGKPVMVLWSGFWRSVWKVGTNLRERGKWERSNGRGYWEGAMKLNGERGTLNYPTRF